MQPKRSRKILASGAPSHDYITTRLVIAKGSNNETQERIKVVDNSFSD